MQKTYNRRILQGLATCCLLLFLASCNSPRGSTSTGPTPTPFFGIKPYTLASGHTDTVTDEAWSPNEQFIASSSEDGTVIVWNAVTGQKIYTYHSPSASVKSLAWSPDSKRIVSGGSDGVAQIWDATTGNNVLNYRTTFGSAYAVAWSPNGKYIADGAAVVDIWNATTGKLVVSLSNTSVFGPTALQWSPDSKRLAVGPDGTPVTQIWSVPAGKLLLTYHNQHAQLRTLAWSPNGQFIASGDVNGTIHVWNASTGAHSVTYKGQTQGTGISGVGWLPDGQRVVSASRDGTVQIWNATSGKRLFIYKDPSGDIEAMAVSPDGSYVVLAGIDMQEQIAKLE